MRTLIISYMMSIFRPSFSLILFCMIIPTTISFSSSPTGELSYFNDWGMMGGRPTQPTCVDIPVNMTLCYNISYAKMRLPNLLEHDTMAEVSQQAASWVPLLNIKCHPDTQLFLCSLFSPVCLDRPIYPCRSLCEKVKSGCEGRMRVYGFPWPNILRCEKFPLDNDMCITAQSSGTTAVDNSACHACSQIETYENILDNFCRAEFALKTKVKKVKKSKVMCRKSKLYKTSTTDKKELRSLRRPTFRLDNLQECCGKFGQDIKINYLIMGIKKGTELIPTFIMEWKTHSKVFRNAIRMFKKLDCSDPKMVSESMLADGSVGGSVQLSNSKTLSEVSLLPLPSRKSGNNKNSRDRITVLKAEIPSQKTQQQKKQHHRHHNQHSEPSTTLTAITTK